MHTEPHCCIAFIDGQPKVWCTDPMETLCRQLVARAGAGAAASAEVSMGAGAAWADAAVTLIVQRVRQELEEQEEQGEEEGGPRCSQDSDLLDEPSGRQACFTNRHKRHRQTA